MLSHYQRRAEATLQRAPRTKFPVFNGYVLLEEIGHGAFGQVRLALSLRTMQPVAVKIISKTNERRTATSIRVRREITSMQKVQHPNIVKLIDVVSTTSFVLIVMEFVEGCELFDEIEYFRRLSEPYARFLFQQLVRGLEHSHSRGVFHRDLKPDNLLVDRNKTLKITDFGVANMNSPMFSQDTAMMRTAMMRTQVGTPHYVAPEVVIVSEGGYNAAKADAWSCGVILFIMCSGYLPFNAESHFEIFSQILRCHVVYPTHFSPELKDLLSKIFVSPPSSRLSLTQISRHPWFFGPTATSEIGDDRLKRPSKLEEMSDAIQEVIRSYNDYKEASAIRSPVSHIPVVLHPPSATHAAASSTHSPFMHGHMDNNETRDSLAFGWVHDSNVGLTAAGIPTGATEAELVSDTNAEILQEDYVSNPHEAGSALSDSPCDEVEESWESSLGSESNMFEETNLKESELDKVSDEPLCALRRVRSLDAIASDKWHRTSSTRSNIVERKLHSASFAVSNDHIDGWGASDSQRHIELRVETKLEKLRHSLWDALMTKQDVSTADSTGANTDEGEVLLPSSKTRRIVRSRSLDRFDAATSLSIDLGRHLGDDKMAPEWTKSTPVHRFRGRSRGTSREFDHVNNLSAPLLSCDEIEEQEYVHGMWANKPNKVWCDFVRDIDMIPDKKEHGLSSSELQNLWAESLEREGIRKRCSPKKRTTRNGSSFVTGETFPRRRPPSDNSPSLDVRLQRSSQTMTEDVNVAQSLPAIREEETVVIGGDLLTQKGLPRHWLSKFVEKTRIDYEEEASIKRVKSMKKKSEIAIAFRYYNDVMTEAKSEPYNILAKGHPQGIDVSVSDFAAEMKLSAAGTVGLDSALSGRNVSSDLSSRHPIAPGLNRIAIGPLHKDYKRERGEQASDDDLKVKQGEAEEIEIAGKLKIFEFDIPGPVHSLTLPAQLPFEKYLRKPVKMVRRRLPSQLPKFLWFRSSFIKFSSLEDVDTATQIVTAVVEKEGGTVRLTRKREGSIRMCAVLPVNVSKLTLIIHILLDSNPAIRIPCCTVFMKRASGDQEKFDSFLSGFQSKLDNGVD